MRSKLENWARGRIYGYMYNPLTGEKRDHFAIHNVITYTAADIMARLVGGDTQYIPGYMGFIYGSNASPGGALVEPPTSRQQTWTTLGSELSDAGVTGNVLITPLAAGAAYAVDGNSTYYSGNEVTLTANSATRLEYGYQTSSPYAAELANGDYFYHVMIITRLVSGSTITYLPFARATLMEGSSYPQKSAGFEMAVYWPVSFM
jgi:hypothetical protein